MTPTVGGHLDPVSHIAPGNLRCEERFARRRAVRGGGFAQDEVDVRQGAKGAELHVAQPALTRHMRTLERDLGVRLFARNGRGITLTNAGVVFRDRVRGVLRELDRAQMEVKALSRSPGGRIDFGMPFSISQALTRILVQRVHVELPGVSLRIIDGWTGFIIEWLLRGRLSSDFCSTSQTATVSLLPFLAVPCLHRRS